MNDDPSVHTPIPLDNSRRDIPIQYALKSEFYRWSSNYQCLPCDVHITSYINNLHPSHSSPCQSNCGMVRDWHCIPSLQD
ncbi:hypothetical protein P175DRAFT_0496982 [Aspergillus ochraceoroseus IBT 24754]|uniref:DUF4246 domain-containing protein n=1 Tax=Aspergillus ochraceoroseus IBT 24754 TaxID=1392256 RepID=A0A2T5M5P2_9EURO|nr:uncharacterized protein P175DRAFT_0496982 [Aspergillus ochraceoroseus IBT 24754]PTU23855.1 hypothetical protein P175DRAFT_0496982 [Aspergillus ochraceoroseus IBT 24754]